MKRNRAPQSVRVASPASAARTRVPGKYVVLALGAAAATFAVTAAVWPQPAVDAPRAPAVAALYAPLGEYLVDLAPDIHGRVAYLRISLDVQLASQGALAAIEAERPAVDERVSFFLRQLTPEDLDGSEASTRLKSELRRRIELAAGEGAIRDVIVRQLIVQ